MSEGWGELVSKLLLHLVFSPPRPPMSFSALSSLRAHRSTWNSSWAFSSVFSSKVFCRAARRSSTSFSSPLFWSNRAMVVARDCWASSRLAFFGATTYVQPRGGRRWKT